MIIVLFANKQLDTIADCIFRLSEFSMLEDLGANFILFLIVQIP